jgi:hypothetical protein
MAEDLNRSLKVPDNMGDLSLGVNFKFSSRKIGTANGLTADGGSTVDLDLATIFKPNDNLSLGLSMQNIFGGAAAPNAAGLTTAETVVPAVQAGISGKLFGDAVIWSLQSDSLGCEWQPVHGLSLRAGRGDDRMTTGFGFNLSGFSVDYAYAGGADPVHYWSVSIIPEKPAARAAVPVVKYAGITSDKTSSPEN